ncbi:MAG: hypothetical protein MPI95_06090 [Nitrosopumilus sp.]|nr:hypothetical protein [Nitrosopumilus sp.]CAI9832511.1 conserved hypothetical protein [Nitrosopumilaceae archaeon]MDA7941497.1 hypothetical protein [Nitrosopumilus sp.]MDA7943361.1 hypothetical protein [Nitrosopumilus sp.]MDA7944810.1 hypothetical protein [Nitrosopumilus sp.]
MNAEERRRLQELDDLVLGASGDDLRRVQDADRRTQLEGQSLYETYVDPALAVRRLTL